MKAIWLRLRNCHCESKLRQKKCIKSRALATAINMWKYHKHMEFLKLYMANRAPEGNLENDSADENT